VGHNRAQLLEKRKKDEARKLLIQGMMRI